MKKALFLLSIFTWSHSFAQTDSLDLANDFLDQYTDSTITALDSLGFDFTILRIRGVNNKLNRGNRCYLSAKKRGDTCSITGYYWASDDMQIRHGSISRRSVIPTKGTPTCDDVIEDIRLKLSLYKDYFIDEKPSYSDFSQAQYTIIAKIEGRYLYELFEEDFISEFHSGMLYDSLGLFGLFVH